MSLIVDYFKVQSVAPDCTVNEGSNVAIDLSGKLIEIYVKPLLARNIAQVGNFIKAILKC
jgi:hypothetical protein